ncbi:MAG: RpiB/LacA/LacB family sugar-phosphate isomerase [Anaerolineae bacterium]|jgi:ribose 5-phosphate isomerase B|uniref:RpiB/LacA/LacB family sugar-phosphate isomerase n=1 Tax=Candidatus Amarolinea dominans TaxID=3140696 RepID=UPI001E089EA4|nr:RpiB/LacA/LacB family sugar-phosphate isomerase [Anaerolineae bacterium]MBK7200432.1 RpiB/LacA/LacB family sugar-phosphate isomerase [Anaerolineae bacterium]MBK9092698.1 RpiB/LacA/LacB family sugar-phosphate isomerase [Anaerolineae bacterium]MBK9230777.1 RpiB/LacA/LacB family sugar-phosphate isomerase [Anaerolineae bacterium]
MKIAIGSDERTHLTDFVVHYLQAQEHEVLLFGPLAEDDPDGDWPLVSSHVAAAVASGQADQGVLFCWTGTGASIAANKVPGVRAALVHDAETARGARIWNHANVLTLSLRSTPVGVAKEILDAWFSTPIVEGEAVSEWNLTQIARVTAIENRYRGA